MAKAKSVLFYRQGKLLRYDGKNISNADFKKSKELFCGTVIPLQYVKVISFKLPKSLSQEDRAVQVEIKMYNDGGLNAEKEYIIDFLSYDTEGEEQLIEAFALLKEDFETALGAEVKKLSAIDLAFPRFLTYQTLYDANKEHFTTKCDLYIYIEEDEAFGALYFKGRYIGHRNINSLSSLSKRTGIELAKIKEYLQTKGFIHSNYELDEMHIIDTIQEIVLKDIEKLVYSVNHKRGLFGVDGIENVYVDFFGDTIKGIEEFFAPFGYTEIKSKAIQLKDENNSRTDIALACRYIFAINEGADIQKINLTAKERKKPIYRYEAFRYGALIATVLLIMLGIGSYVSYEQFQAKEILKTKKRILQKRKKKVASIMKRLKEFKTKNTDINKKIASIEKEIYIYETTLKAIPMIMQQKIQRQRFVNDVVATLAKYKLNTQHIRQKDAKEMDILLISKSKNRETISKFIQDILLKGYSKAYTDKIYNEDGVYMSNVKVLQ